MQPRQIRREGGGRRCCRHFRLFMIPDMDHCGLPAQTLPKVHYADCVAFKTQRQNRFATDSPLGRAGISRVDVWSTDKMPIDNSDAAAELQRKGFVVRHNYVGSGQGSVCRVVEFAPGGAKFMHRTETLDYAICLKGECDLELDDGRTVPMKAGDICVQRGTMHAW